jgi:hypothetical protein
MVDAVLRESVWIQSSKLEFGVDTTKMSYCIGRERMEGKNLTVRFFIRELLEFGVPKQLIRMTLSRR